MNKCASPYTIRKKRGNNSFCVPDNEALDFVWYCVATAYTIWLVIMSVVIFSKCHTSTLMYSPSYKSYNCYIMTGIKQNGSKLDLNLYQKINVNLDLVHFHLFSF